MHFTEVLQTDRGRAVRADWTITESVEPERLVLRAGGRGHAVRGRPGQAARREILLQPAGDAVTRS